MLRVLNKDTVWWLILILAIPFGIVLVYVPLHGINLLLKCLGFKPIPIPEWLKPEKDKKEEKSTENLVGDENGKQQ